MRLRFVESILGLPEVTESELSLKTDEVVLRFKVAVDDPLAMQVLKTAQDLEGE